MPTQIENRLRIYEQSPQTATIDNKFIVSSDILYVLSAHKLVK